MIEKYRRKTLQEKESQLGLHNWLIGISLEWGKKWQIPDIKKEKYYAHRKTDPDSTLYFLLHKYLDG